MFAHVCILSTVTCLPFFGFKMPSYFQFSHATAALQTATKAEMIDCASDALTIPHIMRLCCTWNPRPKYAKIRIMYGMASHAYPQNPAAASTWNNKLEFWILVQFNGEVGSEREAAKCQNATLKPLVFLHVRHHHVKEGGDTLSSQILIGRWVSRSISIENLHHRVQKRLLPRAPANHKSVALQSVEGFPK